MFNSENSIGYEEFTRWLRHGLHNLYDFSELRRNPLVELLTENKTSSPASFQAILLEAIESMRPASTLNPQATANRSFRILYHRYVEQFSQSEVADDLGIGERHLRRQETIAVNALAGYLVKHHRLNLGEAAVLISDEDEPAGEPITNVEGAASVQTIETESELKWLQQSFPAETVQTADLVKTALMTVESMANSLGIELTWTLAENLPDVLVQIEPVRQALVITLTEGLRSTRKGRIGVEVKADQNSQWVLFQVEGNREPGTGELAELSLESTDWGLVQQLLALSNCLLELPPSSPEKFHAQIKLPVLQQVAVLFIDDNADTLQLFQRYLADTSFIFLGAREQEQAFKLISQSLPKLIVTDVMMPGIDGWQLLGQLRNHPLTQKVPIIVCSILPQEQLAYSLGASAFLQKPISRELLLQTLNEHLKHLPAKGSSLTRL